MAQAALHRLARFVVTAKGTAASTDGLRTFRLHLAWAVPMAAAFGVAAARGSLRIEVLLWPTMVLVICLAPVVHWAARRERPDAADVAAVSAPLSIPAPRSPVPVEEAAS